SDPFFYPPENPSNKVFVNEDQDAPFVTVRFGAKAGRIVGHVLDAETNLPIRDVWVGLCRVEVPRYCHRLTAKSADGRFQQLVPSATFTIQISAPGYEDWYGDEGEGRRPEPMQVAPGATRQLNVSLQRSPASGDGKPGRPVLEAPRALSPAAGVEFDHYPRVTRVEWSAVPRAASYTVEVEFCMPGGADRKECVSTHPLEYSLAPPQSGIEGTSYEFLFLGAQPGRWRVWAVDAQGRAGAKSPWSKFLYTQ
ncbi:MAG: carboxypeptidase-like regulatory domain-containing protein, partial [Acidobacteria bacterium]|nr:carboxypeptidase-like regulatory domain-containing protein [Acidobacteriota bacterium]